MTALVGDEVKVTFSAVRGVAGGFVSRAAAQPQQAAGEDRADLLKVGWEIRGRVVAW